MSDYPPELIRHMPTAYALGCNSQQGSPVSEADRLALREHDRHLNRKFDAARERAHERMKRVWEHSPRTRKR